MNFFGCSGFPFFFFCLRVQINAVCSATIKEERNKTQKVSHIINCQVSYLVDLETDFLGHEGLADAALIALIDQRSHFDYI